MNKQIRKLAEQATSTLSVNHEGYRGSKGYTEQVKYFDKEKFAELIVKECGELVKARLNHIPDDQYDWVGYNYGETAVVYGLLDTFQEHFGVDCDPKNSKFGIAK